MAAAIAEGSRVVVPAETKSWPRGNELRRAGVSCLGFGGSNSHVVLEEPPRAPNRAAGQDRGVHILKFAAKSSIQIAQMAERLREHLEARPELRLGDVCYSANVGRAEFEERAGLVVRSRSELLDRLDAVANQRDAQNVFRARAGRKTPKVVLAFSDVGPQELDAGSRLHETEPLFAERVDKCNELFETKAALSVRDVLVGKSKLDAHQCRGTCTWACGRRLQFSMPSGQC